MLDIDLIIDNIPENIDGRLRQKAADIIFKHSDSNNQFHVNEINLGSLLSEICSSSYKQAIDDVEAALQTIDQSQD